MPGFDNALFFALRKNALQEPEHLFFFGCSVSVVGEYFKRLNERELQGHPRLKNFFDDFFTLLSGHFSAARIRAFYVGKLKFNFDIQERQFSNQLNRKLAVSDVVTTCPAYREVRRKVAFGEAVAGLLQVRFDLGEDLTPGFEFVHAQSSLVSSCEAKRRLSATAFAVFASCAASLYFPYISER